MTKKVFIRTSKHGLICLNMQDKLQYSCISFECKENSTLAISIMVRRQIYSFIPIYFILFYFILLWAYDVSHVLINLAVHRPARAWDPKARTPSCKIVKVSRHIFHWGSATFKTKRQWASVSVSLPRSAAMSTAVYLPKVSRLSSPFVSN